MILRHSSGFRQRVFAVSLTTYQLTSYSLMIQGQQSFAQQQDKAAYVVSCNLYRPWMEVNIKYNLNQEQARRIEKL